MGKLVLFRADGTAQHYKLDRERMTIGRRPDNDMCIAHPAVSGEHAAVVTILADSFLEDLGSTNGTLVNGDPISKYFLRDRDEIDIGRQVLVYLEDDAGTIDGPPQARTRPDGPKDGGEDAPLRDKRRSDGRAPVPGRSVDAIQRFVAAEIESGGSRAPASAPETTDAHEESLPGQLDDSGFALKVLSGVGAGRIVGLTQSETLIGRAGIQVAALRRMAGEIHVVPLEGASPPRVNGVPASPDGQKLIVGDILELDGTTLVFTLATAEAGS